MPEMVAGREHPILFKAPMIRALLDGRKSVTRRMSKQWLKVKAGDRLWVKETWASPSKYIVAYSAGAECGAWIDDGDGGQIWNHHGFIIESPDYHDAASKSKTGACRTFGLAKYGGVPHGEYPFRYGWCSSRFMPKWASRITLECLEDARVERLQDITEEEARLEGVERWPFCAEQPMTSGELGADCPYRGGFAVLWDELHDVKGERWFDNPEVVRVGAFRRIA